MNPIAYPGNEVANARESIFPQDAPVCGITRLIGVLLGVNANSATTDFAIPLLLLPGANFVIDSVLLNNASTSLTTATYGVFTAAAAGGVTIVANGATNLSSLTVATSNLIGTLAATATTTVFNQATLTTPSTIYVRTGTAQGGAATYDIYIWGKVLT